MRWVIRIWPGPSVDGPCHPRMAWIRVWHRTAVIKNDSLRDQNWFAMIKIGSRYDGEMENRLAVIKKDYLLDQNWFAMIKIGSQCDGEIENRLAVIKTILCVIKIGS